MTSQSCRRHQTVALISCLVPLALRCNVVTSATRFRYDTIQYSRFNGRFVALLQRMGLPTLPSYMAARFLMLDVTVSREPMSWSEANRQLSYYTILLLISVTWLFGIERKPVLGLQFTVTGLSWVDYNLELNSVALIRVAMSRNLRRPSRFAGRQHNNPALIIHAYAARTSGDVRREALVIRIKLLHTVGRCCVSTVIDIFCSSCFEIYYFKSCSFSFAILL